MEWEKKKEKTVNRLNFQRPIQIGLRKFGILENAPVRGAQCVQSVGAGLPDCPAGCIQHDNRGWANPWPVLLSPGLDEYEPCTRAVEDACPYKRNREVWFLRGAAIIDNIRFKLSQDEKHIRKKPWLRHVTWAMGEKGNVRSKVMQGCPYSPGACRRSPALQRR